MQAKAITERFSICTDTYPTMVRSVQLKRPQKKTFTLKSQKNAYF